MFSEENFAATPTPSTVYLSMELIWWCVLMNPDRFAHFPVRPESFRPRVVSPTFPFAPESFRPLPRSPLNRFTPYKILFLVLLFRPQKWYKALFFLAYWWFFVITYKRWKKTEHFTVFWKVTQQSSYVNRNPDLFSVFCVHISHELLWHRKSVFYIVRILSISYFCHFLWTHGHFNF